MRNDSIGTPPENISRWKFSGTDRDRFLRKTDFHKYLRSLGEIIRLPAVTSILMPPRFHIVYSLPYVPNFSGVPQKFTFLLTVWPPAPPKVRGSYFLSSQKGDFRSTFLEKIKFPGQTVHIWPHSVIYILKAVHLSDEMSYIEAVLVHPVRRHYYITFYNIWDCVIYKILKKA